MNHIYTRNIKYVIKMFNRFGSFYQKTGFYPAGNKPDEFTYLISAFKIRKMILKIKEKDYICRVLKIGRTWRRTKFLKWRRDM